MNNPAAYSRSPAKPVIAQSQNTQTNISTGLGAKKSAKKQDIPLSFSFVGVRGEREILFRFLKKHRLRFTDWVRERLPDRCLKIDYPKVPEYELARALISVSLKIESLVDYILRQKTVDLEAARVLVLILSDHKELMRGVGLFTRGPEKKHQPGRKR